MERRDKKTECRRGGTGSERVRGEGEGGGGSDIYGRNEEK